ncbi:hypothetical protein SOVF_135910 [Spinacia oleracea]|uniref:Uncharacterized protein isoform X2 n=1 Tax=Spinacia oleracea TaxID=3562 RepID=A0A9R0JHC7_SPIOL|nr:uncharacterized protein LOC110806210 isoform X2 [Spinacia oleracea]KNA11360.1 hypothetical protein SOVF_135910 [Spinacia oleracea]
MHQKKSEVQIGKESSGISSDFNPSPPSFFPSLITQKHPNFGNFNHFNHQIIEFQSNPPLSSSIGPISGVLDPILVKNDPNFGSIPSPSSSASTPKNPLLSTPHKRPLMNPTQSLVKSPTLPSSLSNYPFSSTPTSDIKYFTVNSRCASLLLVVSTAKSAAFRLIRRCRHLRRLRVHLRLLLLLALPFFYFLVSHPSHSFILDFLSAFAFSAALLFSLNLALPRLPSIRVFLNRSFPFPIKLSSPSAASRPLPVFWSIGSRSKVEKKVSSGCWVQVYSNGDVYEGEFHKGKCSGSGVYYYYMSGRYEGDWIDGKYDGHGVETWARGSRYRGQYRQGLRHGFGVYRFYTGDVYAGEWSNGQSHGCGKHTCEDGSRYVGEFKWGVKHGLGHYHFRNGDTYAGEYFADKMHGFGVYKFANGHRYEGAWHEGRRQGLGMYTFRNGETQAGHWNNGILDVPSTQNATCPVSPVAVNHSKVLNAVQEARRAAEKAYDVAKVDERVNRAVTAANRAANAARVAAVKAVQKQMHHDIKHDHQTPAPIV